MRERIRQSTSVAVALLWLGGSVAAADLHGVTEGLKEAACEKGGCEQGPMEVPREPVAGDSLGVPTPILDPSGRALTPFYEALEATARDEGKTRVAIYGASHVAGDVFMRGLRHRLKDQYGDAGPGFVVPSYPWRDYNHRDVEISYTKDLWSPWWVSSKHSREDGLYGLAGVAFTSGNKRASARVRTAKRGRYGRTASELEVYYWKARRGGDLLLQIDGSRPKRIRTRSRRSGPGYATYKLKDEAHEIVLKPRGNGDTHLFGLSLERNVSGVVVDTMGVNGARASAQLAWDPRLFAEHLTRRAPSLVILAYGTNATGDVGDAIRHYERRIDHVVNRVKSLVPDAACVLVGPSDRPIKMEGPPEDEGGEPTLLLASRPRQAEVIEAQKRVAERYGCGFWDMVAAMGGDLSMVQWVAAEPKMGARDYVHLTRKGYERLGDLFWDALMVGMALKEEAAAVEETDGPAVE